jgi:hypothetical protein
MEHAVDQRHKGDHELDRFGHPRQVRVEVAIEGQNVGQEVECGENQRYD